MKLGRLVWWPLFGGVTALVLVLLLLGEDADGALVGVGYLAYGLLGLAALHSVRKAGIDPMEVIGSPPKDARVWRRTVLMVPLMLVFAALSLWATAYAASWAMPGLAEFVLRADEQQGALASFRGLWGVLLGVLIVVLAPIVEEFVFRGVLLRRWVERYGMWRGAAASAAVFALLHPPFWIGAFVLGIVLGMLYLATRSLMVPILFHVVYNGTVLALTRLADGAANAEAERTLAQFQAQWVGEAAILAISSVLVFFVVRRLAVEAASHPAAAATVRPTDTPG